jgi:hypothetical protein
LRREKDLLSSFFPCHGAAQRAKTENFFLAFIFLQRKKINAFQVLKSFLTKSYSHSFYLPTRVGNKAKVLSSFNNFFAL